MGLDLPHTILFDLDNTILELNSEREDYWNFVTRKYSGLINPVLYSELSSKILEKGDWFWSDQERNRKGRLNLRQSRRTIVQLALDDLGISHDGLAIQIADDFSELRENGANFSHLIPGCVETLNHLKSKGVRVALVTNGGSKAQRSKLEQFGLMDLFDEIFIEEEIGIGKPHPEFYSTVLSKLDLLPGDAWMVGDNLFLDVLAPQKLGIKGVWVNPGMKENDGVLKPFMTIGSIAELMEHQ